MDQPGRRQSLLLSRARSEASRFGRTRNIEGLRKRHTQKEDSAYAAPTSTVPGHEGVKVQIYNTKRHLDEEVESLVEIGLTLACQRPREVLD